MMATSKPSYRISLVEETQRGIPLGDLDARQSQYYHRRTPHIRAEVQGVRFKRLAPVLDGYSRQHPRARNVYHNRDGHYQECPNRRVYLNRLGRQALDGFVNDPGAGPEQQQRFNQRRKVLDLPMAVVMVLVSRLCRETHRKPGDDRRRQIQPGMGRLRQNPQAAAQQPDR